MALGSYDANGIWNYGESDNIAPFSTTLNKLASSTSSALTSDRSRISTLEAGSLAGLIPVKPTTVTFTAGTGAISSVGMVTFTGCTGVTLSNVFTSAFKNYRVVMGSYKTSANAGGLGVMRLTSGGSALSTGYDGGYTGWYNGGTSVVNSGGGDGWYLMPIFYTHSTASIDVYNPAETSVTRINGNSIGSVAASGVYTVNGGSNTSTAAYDGLTIYWNSGNWNGSIQVFGYND